MHFGNLTLPELQKKEAALQKVLDAGKGDKTEIERHLRIVRSRIEVYLRSFYG